jgi:hypothetical protein
LINPQERYEKRMKYYEKMVRQLSVKINRISNWRLFAFLAGTGCTVAFYVVRYYFLCGAAAIMGIAAFIWLVVCHERLLALKNYAGTLLDISKQSLNRVSGRWTSFDDTGEDFRDDEHFYASDLDIFGRGSLFQYVNTAFTHTGRKVLARFFIKPLKDVQTISERQQAVDELARRFGWRQRFEAEARLAARRTADPAGLIMWAGDWDKAFLASWKPFILRMLPVVTIVLVLGAFVFGVFSWHFPVTALVVQTLLLKYKGKERYKVLGTAIRFKDDIRVYERMLRIFEKRKFDGSYLVRLGKRLENNRSEAACKQVEKLVKIADSISNRNNAYYIVFNILTLWDYQCLIALESWKRDSGSRLEEWLEVLGELEALASLSVLRHDHEDWATAGFEENKLLLEAASMGHPLLSASRICNDLRLARPVGVLLITGSNMSGKSTLLRTAGINLVLAYAGAPVCAAGFQCALMDIYTCMRISDSLEKNISSFYAEILRIKMIVEAVNRGQKVFFLLDEIFRGTNSKDRHMGAKILVQKLVRANTLGLVSTHDLELGELEKESEGRVKNGHFREYYEGNRIRFDYKLRPGVSTTRNAAYLMRMAGIEVEDEGK